MIMQNSTAVESGKELSGELTFLGNRGTNIKKFPNASVTSLDRTHQRNVDGKNFCSVDGRVRDYADES